MSSQNNGKDELNKGLVEIGALGTLATALTMFEGVGMITLGTLGAATFTVSLPAVAAFAAAATLGISVGSKIVKASDNSGSETNNMNKENRAKA